ncbi:MAG: fumarate hydratase, partial [Clostridia bacterium]|nr:fumarate hydratase [Clostridia bacterium]
VIENGSFENAVNVGVREAYRDGFLRKSIVSDPVFERKNTLDNTPAIIHTKIVEGDKIKITAGGKGFGSENMSKIKMLSPSAGIEGIKEFVLDTVKHAGPNPCPPIVVGVGIGGTFEMCAQLAKRATFRNIDIRNEDIRYKEVEEELLSLINKMGFGPAGLGGKTTALAVNIETMPTHIAGMPVAVNICCHAARHKSAVI